MIILYLLHRRILYKPILISQSNLDNSLSNLSMNRYRKVTKNELREREKTNGKKGRKVDKKKLHRKDISMGRRKVENIKIIVD